MKIRIEKEVPDGDTCIGCKEYDYHAEWCNFFRMASVGEDKKHYKCLEAAEAYAKTVNLKPESISETILSR